MSVDLPEPDGPMTAVRRPSAMSTRDAAQGVDRGVALAVAADDVACGDDGAAGGSRARGRGRWTAWRCVWSHGPDSVPAGRGAADQGARRRRGVPEGAPRGR